MKVGDLVRMSQKGSPWGDSIPDEANWRGMIVRHVGLCENVYGDDHCNNEWEVHWLHNPPNETSFEYGYYLEVLSESR